MANLKFPLFSDVENYTYSLDLDGEEFIFRFQYNERDTFWYISIFDINENPLRTGVKLVSDEYINRFLVSDAGPNGVLMFVDTTGAEREAGLDDLVPDGDFEVVYAEAGIT